MKWGRDDLIVMAAFRYCLGRRTYIVSDCVEWLIQHWDEFKPGIRDVIKRDLEEEFERHERGGDYKPLGDDCDVREWEKVRKLWEVVG